MLFLGYDPGGKGTHGVASINVADDGSLLGNPTCDVMKDAEDAWKWLSEHSEITALGIDTLLAWSPYGGRACDDALRKVYPQHAATVIPQNSLYSSMTINGAIVARRAEQLGIPLFESHPKLIVKTRAAGDPDSVDILGAYHGIKDQAGTDRKSAKRADDMADAIVAAWCAAQGWTKRWSVNLYNLPGDKLEPVAKSVSYPWPEQV